MPQRIEIKLKTPDSRAQIIRSTINSEFNNIINKVVVSDIYTLEKNISKNEFKKVKPLIFNSAIEEISLNSFFKEKFDFALEIGYLPGVTDNVGNTAKQVFKDALNNNINVYSSKIYYLSGKIDKKDVKQIGEFLSNKLIQRVHIKSYTKFIKDKGMNYILPKVKLNDNTTPTKVKIISIPDCELVNIGKKGIVDPKTKKRRGPLALDSESMKTIQTYFREIQERDPTDIELESLAQTWSEHCKHTIFAAQMDEISEGLYERYIKRATNTIRKSLKENDFCISVFSDNSGVIKFNEDYFITDKAETHNSPCALDPFGGAITGIVGVNRDTIGVGMGALPIVNGFGFCVANPLSKKQLYRSKNRKNPVLSSKRIMQGVVKGVKEGGNCSGIPTVQGFINFHKDYSGKPLVFVRTIGLMPKKVGGKNSTKKRAQNGDLIVVVGGRVGKDGIHGATFSSEGLNSGSPVSAVQIGDPITQKKLSDALIKEARDLDLYNSITDNGAGGLSCSVAEMAKESGGCVVDLEKVPLKYSGMSSWEIWISESQERMTLSIPKNRWNQFNALMESRGVEAKIIGKFTNSGLCIVKKNKKIIMNIDLDFLHNGLPVKKLKTTFTKKIFEEPKITKISIKDSLIDMVGRLNICSTEFIFRQYDHEVGAGSVLKPIVGVGNIISETSIVKPLISSKKAIGLSQALFPRYGDIDTYNMALCSVDTAVKNLVCAGVLPNKIALMDNFCWCSSNNPKRLGQLKRAAKACFDISVAYKTPFISGKDSMFNDFQGYDKNNNPVKISVPPTLLISSIGVMDDFRKSVSPEVKFKDDLIYLIGETKDELGGSEFYSYLGEKETGRSYTGNNVPNLNIKLNKAIYKKVGKLIQEDLLASVMPINLGGLGVALAKIAIGGKLGISVDLNNIPDIKSLGDVKALYSETPGRILVTINPQNKDKFEKSLKTVSFVFLGKVVNNKNFYIKGKNQEVLTDINYLKKKYKQTLKKY